MKLRAKSARSGYLLVEALVYIGLVFVLLGIGTSAMYRAIDNSVALRRNADDITRAVHVGERWRADVRSANQGVLQEEIEGQPLVRLKGDRGEVDYRYNEDSVYRRTGEGP